MINSPWRYQQQQHKHDPPHLPHVKYFIDGGERAGRGAPLTGLFFPEGGTSATSPPSGEAGTAGAAETKRPAHGSGAGGPCQAQAAGCPLRLPPGPCVRVAAPRPACSCPHPRTSPRRPGVSQPPPARPCRRRMSPGRHRRDRARPPPSLPGVAGGAGGTCSGLAASASSRPPASAASASPPGPSCPSPPPPGPCSSPAGPGPGPPGSESVSQVESQSSTVVGSLKLALLSRLPMGPAPRRARAAPR